jgi:hypothetical protein
MKIRLTFQDFCSKIVKIHRGKEVRLTGKSQERLDATGMRYGKNQNTSEKIGILRVPE